MHSYFLASHSLHMIHLQMYATSSCLLPSSLAVTKPATASSRLCCMLKPIAAELDKKVSIHYASMLSADEGTDERMGFEPDYWLSDFRLTACQSNPHPSPDALTQGKDLRLGKENARTHKLPIPAALPQQAFSKKCNESFCCVRFCLFAICICITFKGKILLIILQAASPAIAII